MNLKPLLSGNRAARLMFAALVMALAGSVATLVQAQPFGGPGHHHGGYGHGSAMGGYDGAMGGRMFEHMLDGVNATTDQRNRIRGIMKTAMEDVRKQREAGRGLRAQAMTLFTQPTVDPAAVEALRKQMMDQHDQVSRRMMQSMLEASAVLTPEQRAQLAERTKQRRDMMERHYRERRALEPPKS
jgi:Spy/CpxP family protein refolding chaperone